MEEGGFLLTSNVLSPNTELAVSDLRFLGFERQCDVYSFEIEQPTGARLIAAVQGYKASSVGSPKAIRKTLRELDSAGTWQERELCWHWNAERIERSP